MTLFLKEFDSKLLRMAEKKYQRVGMLLGAPSPTPTCPWNVNYGGAAKSEVVGFVSVSSWRVVASPPRAGCPC